MYQEKGETALQLGPAHLQEGFWGTTLQQLPLCLMENKGLSPDLCTSHTRSSGSNPRTPATQHCAERGHRSDLVARKMRKG